MSRSATKSFLIKRTKSNGAIENNVLVVYATLIIVFLLISTEVREGDDQ